MLHIEGGSNRPFPILTSKGAFYEDWAVYVLQLLMDNELHDFILQFRDRQFPPLWFRDNCMIVCSGGIALLSEISP